MKRVRGFTLIELMVVVGIVGIVAALAVPNLNRALVRSRSKDQVQQVRAALVDARNRARNSMWCVQVNVTANTITAQPFLPNPDCATLGAAVGVVQNWSFRDDSTGVSHIAMSPVGTLLVFNETGGVQGGGIKNLSVSTRLLEYRYAIWPAIGTVRLVK